MKARRPRFPLLPLLALASLLIHSSAWAGAFGVAPIRLDLDRATRTGLINVSSDDERKLFFQVKLFEWKQNAAGEDAYAESNDLIFFPQILTLAPKERRVIRVGTKGPPGNSERAYRLFIEELPDPGEVAAGGAQVAVRLRFGVPIFFSPGPGQPRIEIASSSLGKGEVMVAVRNQGDRQLRLEELQVGRGEKVFGKAAGWYVFPGATRVFSIPVAREECPTSGPLLVRATGEGRELRATLEAAPGLCTQ